MRNWMQAVGMAAMLVLAACNDGTGGGLQPTEPSFSLSPSVQLSGPATVQSNHTCEWYAYASGGTAPYTWTWSQSNGGSGFPNPRTSTLESYYTSTSGTMTLYVTITDALGRTGSASKTITTSWTAAECYI
jgi:hypothetical protein